MLNLKRKVSKNQRIQNDKHKHIYDSSHKPLHKDCNKNL